MHPAAGARRNLLAAVLGVILLTLQSPAVAGGQFAAALQEDACTPVPVVNDRCPSWVATYDNANGHNGDDSAQVMALSPDGIRAFVAGQSWDNDTGGYDVATAAFDPATGNPLWAARYSGSANGWDQPLSVEVSPDGSTVFTAAIVNQEWVPNSHGLIDTLAEFGVMAYDAATGHELWTSTYKVPGAQLQVSWPSGMAVSADGRHVYLTGYSQTYAPAGPSLATIVAFDAASGHQEWASRKSVAPGDSIGVSPAGDRVYVTGSSQGAIQTITYEAADPERLGEVVWTASFGSGTSSSSFGRFLRVSRDGSRVFVTGEYNQVNGLDGHSEFGTVAYDAATGTRLWASTYAGSTPGFHRPYAMELSEAGDRLFVTGYGLNIALSKSEYATVAYDTVTGAQVWAEEYLAPGTMYNLPWGLASSPDGRRVYVTGLVRVHPQTTTGEVGTVAYDVDTGDQAWVGRYSSSAGRFDYGSGAAVLPDGDLLVAGGSGVRAMGVNGVPVGGSDNPGDFALLRYDA